MDASEVAVLAALVQATYADEALDTDLTEPAVVATADGSRALALPRDQMPEPLRSLHLISTVGVGTTLILTFTWGEDDTLFLVPYDTRDLTLDTTDNIAVRTFVTQLVEHTLGGPRESWEAARSTPIGSRLAVVRPWNAS